MGIFNDNIHNPHSENTRGPLKDLLVPLVLVLN